MCVFARPYWAIEQYMVGITLLLVSLVSPSLVAAGNYRNQPYVADLEEKLKPNRCPWMMLFYMSSCGSCRIFQNTYLKFAEKMKDEPIMVTAFECTDISKCKGEITGVPSLMYYSGSTDPPTEKMVTFLENFTMPPLSESNQTKCRERKKNILLDRKAEEKNTEHTPYLSYRTSVLDARHKTTSANQNILDRFVQLAEEIMPILKVDPSKLSDKDRAFHVNTEPVVGAPTCTYPCGLWKLFHTLLQIAPPKKSKALLLSIRDFFTSFYLCQDCRTHFWDLSKNLESELQSSPNAAVLWLWGAHNEVNLRLGKPNFPSNTVCPTCWNDHAADNPALLTHLETLYGPANAHHKPSRDIGHLLVIILIPVFLIVVIMIPICVVCWGKWKKTRRERTFQYEVVDH